MLDSQLQVEGKCLAEPGTINWGLCQVAEVQRPGRDEPIVAGTGHANSAAFKAW